MRGRGSWPATSRAGSISSPYAAKHSSPSQIPASGRTSSPSRNVAQLLVSCLENEGVEIVFGLPGEENLHVIDALADSEIRFITEESASVVTSPTSRFSATSRSRRRMILPLRVFGSSGVKTMFAGFAIGPIFCATWFRSSSSFETVASTPARAPA